MTAEEAENLVRQGSIDPTMVEVLKELDDIQLKTVSTFEKGKKSAYSPSKDYCTSLVVLEMQAYYFYWTLVLLLAGDFTNATRFAKYSDRMYQYIKTFPKELPPRYVHLTVVGNVSALVSYVKKMFEIEERLNQKGRFGDFPPALTRMFGKVPESICLNQIYERFLFLSCVLCRSLSSRGRFGRASNADNARSPSNSLGIVCRTRGLSLSAAFHSSRCDLFYFASGAASALQYLFKKREIRGGSEFDGTRLSAAAFERFANAASSQSASRSDYSA